MKINTINNVNKKEKKEGKNSMLYIFQVVSADLIHLPTTNFSFTNYKHDVTLLLESPSSFNTLQSD